jgi:hypothetical protein
MEELLITLEQSQPEAVPFINDEQAQFERDSVAGALQTGRETVTGSTVRQQVQLVADLQRQD